MSTYGVIARRTGSGFVGRVHHNVGNPHILGKALYRLRNGHFQGDTAAMLRVLVDEHPAGWSDIVGKDFALAPGFVEPRSYLSWEQSCRLPDARQPQCYCHGDRNEEPVTFTETSTPMGASFLYLIDARTHTMEIHVYRWTAQGDPGDEPERLLVGTVALDGPAPSWKRYRSERIFYTREEWAQLQQGQAARALPEGWQEWRRAARQRQSISGEGPACVIVGWFHYAGGLQQRCRGCGKPTARFTFARFGYEGIELDLKSWEEGLARAREDRSGAVLKQLARHMRQKLRRAQQQGIYRVHETEPMCRLCLADYLDAHLEEDGVGDAAARRLRSSGGRISCVFVLEVHVEEAKDPGVFSAFYTDALTMGQLQKEIHPPPGG